MRHVTTLFIEYATRDSWKNVPSDPEFEIGDGGEFEIGDGGVLGPGAGMK